MSVVYIIIAFSIIILVHELGHLIAALKTGVRVERFSIGFGPEIFGFYYGGIRFSVSLVPLGGYVKLYGEEYSSIDSGGFKDKPVSTRLAVSLAGIAMNYLFAFFLFFSIFFFHGDRKLSYNAYILDVMENSPASKAGIKKGDVVIEVDGLSIKTWDEFKNEISKRPGVKTTLKILRGKDIIEVNIVPLNTDGEGRIGVLRGYELVKYGFFKSIYEAFDTILFITLETFKTIFNSIIKLKAPEIMGPVGVGHVVALSAKEGVFDFFKVLALISTAVAVFNILPLPLLDGWHAILAVLERAFRFRISRTFEVVSNSLGIAVLFTIFLYATTIDIFRILR